MVEKKEEEKEEFHSSNIIIYTIAKTNIIDEYLKSSNIENLNQLSDEEFFKLSELSGYISTLDEFEYDFNTKHLKVDAFRFKMIKGIKLKPHAIESNKLL